MFKVCDTKSENLIMCVVCGVVLSRQILMENYGSHSELSEFAECPVCKVRMEVENLILFG